IETRLPQALPRVPNYILGLVPHGLQALPILDLARFLELASHTSTHESELRARTLVVTTDSFTVGIPVSRAIGILQVEATAWRPPELLRSGRLADFLLGETDSTQGLVGILDLAAILESAHA